MFFTCHSLGILDIVCRVVFLFLNDVFDGMALLKSDDAERDTAVEHE